MSDASPIGPSDEYPWYRIVEDDSLQQGDLIQDVPCLFFESTFADDFDPDDTPIGINIFDVIVLSQSCDLAGRKLDNVIICPYYTLDELIAQRPKFQGKKGKEEISNIQKGRQVGMHLLDACPLLAESAPYLVVDFQQAMTVPLGLVEHQSRVNRLASPETRIRLLPPYREHLAQAFGRFVMRIGLPRDIKLPKG